MVFEDLEDVLDSERDAYHSGVGHRVEYELLEEAKLAIFFLVLLYFGVFVEKFLQIVFRLLFPDGKFDDL